MNTAYSKGATGTLVAAAVCLAIHLPLLAVGLFVVSLVLWMAHFNARQQSASGGSLEPLATSPSSPSSNWPLGQMTPENTMKLSAALFAVPFAFVDAFLVIRNPHLIPGGIIMGIVVFTPAVFMWFRYSMISALLVLAMSCLASLNFALVTLHALPHASPLFIVRGIAISFLPIVVAIWAFKAYQASIEIRNRRRNSPAAVFE